MSGHDQCEGCSVHGHHNEKAEKRELITLIIGAVLLAVSFVPIPGLADFPKDVLRFFSAAFCVWPIFASAKEEIVEHRFGENSLLVIAVVSAILIGEFLEAAAVSLFFRIGEYSEEYAESKSRRSIESLFSIMSDTGHLVRDEGGFEQIDADDIKVGMKLAVLPHEIIPVDGVVTSGDGTVDTSAVTGESLPVEITVGSKLISGTVNGNTTVFYEATAEKAESGAARIIAMVEEAAEKKGKAQSFISKFSAVYTPAVVAAAVIVAIIPALASGRWHEWIHRGLAVLVASCPCSVILSTPLAFLSSMGSCAKNGIIIKGSKYIEALAKADTFVFDKTGTLTSSEPVIGEISPADGYDADYVLSLAAKCEYYSSHPLAKAISSACESIDMTGTANFEEIPGGGTAISVTEGRIICGGMNLMKSRNVDVSALDEAPVYVALNGEAVGSIDIVNEVRPEAKTMTEKLKKLGAKALIILTGDTASKAKQVCAEAGLDDCKWGLLPEDKLNAMEEIKKKSGAVVYVGDGINDAPVLAASDVGAAMGLGTQAACEAADLILTNSDLSRLVTAVKQSRKTVNVLGENIIFSLSVKAAVIILSIAGIVPMWLAVFADVGTMLLCVANSSRLMKKMK